MADKPLRIRRLGIVLNRSLSMPKGILWKAYFAIGRFSNETSRLPSILRLYEGRVRTIEGVTRMNRGRVLAIGDHLRLDFAEMPWQVWQRAETKIKAGHAG